MDYHYDNIDTMNKDYETHPNFTKYNDKLNHSWNPIKQIMKEREILNKDLDLGDLDLGEISYRYKDTELHDFFDNSDVRVAMMHAFAESFVEVGTLPSSDIKNIIQQMFYKIRNQKIKDQDINELLYFSQYLLQDINHNMHQHWGYIIGGWNGEIKSGHSIGIFYKRQFMKTDYDVYIINSGSGIKMHGLSQNNIPLSFSKVETTAENLKYTKKIINDFTETPDDAIDATLYYTCILNALSGNFNKDSFRKMPININNLFEKIDYFNLEFPPQLSGSCGFRAVFLLPYLIHVVLMKNISKEDFFNIYKKLAEYWVPAFSKYLTSIIKSQDDLSKRINAYNAHFCLSHLYDISVPDEIDFSSYSKGFPELIEHKNIEIKNIKQLSRIWTKYNSIFFSKRNVLDTTFAKAKYLDISLQEIQDTLNGTRLLPKIEDVFDFCKYFNTHFESDPQYPIVIMGCIVICTRKHTEGDGKIESEKHVERKDKRLLGEDNKPEIATSRRFHVETLSSIPVKSKDNLIQIETILNAFYNTDLPFYVINQTEFWIDRQHIEMCMDETSLGRDYVKFFENKINNRDSITRDYWHQLKTHSTRHLGNTSNIVWQLKNIDPYQLIWKITSLLYRSSTLFIANYVNQDNSVYTFMPEISANENTIGTWFRNDPVVMTNTELYNTNGCINKDYTNERYPCIGLFNPNDIETNNEILLGNSKIEDKRTVFHSTLELNSFPFKFRFQTQVFQNVMIPVKLQNAYTYNLNANTISIEPYIVAPYSVTELYVKSDDPYVISYSKEGNLQIYYNEGLHQTFQCTETQLMDNTHWIHIIVDGIILNYKDEQYRYVFAKQCDQMFNIEYFKRNWFIFMKEDRYIFIPKYHYFNSTDIITNLNSLNQINKYIIEVNNSTMYRFSNGLRLTLTTTMDINIVTELESITEVYYWSSDQSISIIDLPAYNISFEYNNGRLLWNGQHIIQNISELSDSLRCTSILEYVAGLPNVFLVQMSERINLLILELYHFYPVKQSFINFAKTSHLRATQPPRVYGKSIYTLDFHHSYDFLISSFEIAFEQYTLSCLQYEKMSTAFRCLPYIKNVEKLSNTFNIPYFRLFQDKMASVILGYYPVWLQTWYKQTFDVVHSDGKTYFDKITDVLTYVQYYSSKKSNSYSEELRNLFNERWAVPQYDFETVKAKYNEYHFLNMIVNKKEILVPELVQIMKYAKEYNIQRQIPECNYDSEDCLYLDLNGYPDFRPHQRKKIIEIVEELEKNVVTGVHHMKMGDGKTKVITPLVALKLLKNVDNAVLIVLPEILVSQTLLELKKYVQYIFGIDIVLFEKNMTMEKHTIYVTSPITLKKSIINFMKLHDDNTNIWKQYTKSHTADIKVIIDEIDEICDPTKSEYNETKQIGRMAVNHYDFQVKFIIDMINDVFQKPWNERLEHYLEMKKRDDKDEAKISPQLKPYYDYIRKKLVDVLRKKNRVHYGFANVTTDSRSFVVCPFKTLESPNIGSEFLNPTVTLVYMIAALCQDGLHDNMIEVFLREMLNEPLEIIRIRNRTDILKILKLQAGASIDDILKTAQQNKKNKKLILSFMYWYKNTGNIMFNMHSYNCSHTDILVHELFHGKIGLTGTPDDFLRIREHDDKRNGLVEVHENKPDKEYIIRQILDAEQMYSKSNETAILELLRDNQYQCLIDVGMFFTDDPPLIIAQKISEKIGNKDVLYIDPTVESNNIKIYSKGKIIDYTGGLTDAFVFFGYHAITGFDIKMPDCKGLVTLSADTTLRSLSQGIFRLRQIGRGQTIDYVSDITFESNQDILDHVTKNQTKERVQKQTLHNKQNIYTIMRQLNFENSWMKQTHNQIPLLLSEQIDILDAELKASGIDNAVINSIINESKPLLESKEDLNEKELELEIEIELDHNIKVNKDFFREPQTGKYTIIDDHYYKNSHIIELEFKHRIILSPAYIYNYKHSCEKEVCATVIKNDFILMTVEEYKILQVIEHNVPLITNLDNEHDQYPKGILTLLYMGMGIITLDIEYLYDAFRIIQKYNSDPYMIEYVNYILSENKCEIPNYVGLLFIFAKNNTTKMDLFEFVSNYHVPFITLLHADIDKMVVRDSDDAIIDRTMNLFQEELRNSFYKFAKGVRYVDQSSCIKHRRNIPRYILDVNQSLVLKYRSMIYDQDMFKQLYKLEIIQNNPKLIRAALQSSIKNAKYLSKEQKIDNLDLLLKSDASNVALAYKSYIAGNNALATVRFPDIDDDLPDIVQFKDVKEEDKIKIVLHVIKSISLTDLFSRYSVSPPLQDEYFCIINGKISIPDLTNRILLNENFVKSFEDLNMIYVNKDALLIPGIIKKNIKTMKSFSEFYMAESIFDKVLENIDRYDLDHISVEPNTFWFQYFKHQFWQNRYLNNTLYLARFIRYENPYVTTELYKQLGLTYSSSLDTDWCMFIWKLGIKLDTDWNQIIKKEDAVCIKNIFVYTDDVFNFNSIIVKQLLNKAYINDSITIFSPVIKRLIIDDKSGFDLGKITKLILPEVISLIIKRSNRKIDNEKFGGSDNVLTAEDSNRVSISEYFNKITNLFMPLLTSVIEKDSEIIITEPLFKDNNSLQKLNLHSMERIYSHYFYNCSNLTELNLTNLRTIEGDSVFENCANLKVLELPNLDEIYGGNFMFNRMTELTSISCPKLRRIYGNGQDIMPNYLFLESNQLTLVDFSSLESVSDHIGLFSICNLENCKFLLDSYTTPNNKMFNECVLPSKLILDSLRTINKSLIIHDCTNMEKLELPNLIEIHGQHVFSKCPSLEKIVANNLKVLNGDKVLTECPKLKDLHVNSLQEIDRNALSSQITIHLNILSPSILQLLNELSYLRVRKNGNYSFEELVSIFGEKNNELIKFFLNDICSDPDKINSMMKPIRHFISADMKDKDIKDIFIAMCPNKEDVDNVEEVIMYLFDRVMYYASSKFEEFIDYFNLLNHSSENTPSFHLYKYMIQYILFVNNTNKLEIKNIYFKKILDPLNNEIRTKMKPFKNFLINFMEISNIDHLFCLLVKYRFFEYILQDGEESKNDIFDIGFTENQRTIFFEVLVDKPISPIMYVDKKVISMIRTNLMNMDINKIITKNQYEILNESVIKYRVRLIHDLTDNTPNVYSVALNDDRSRLASGSEDSTIRIWDTKSGKCVKTLVGHSDAVISVAWNKIDSNQLASGSVDKTIKIWNTESGDLVETFIGHRDKVMSVAWNYNNLLASGSHDNTIKIWNTESGEFVQTLYGHSKEVLSVAWNYNNLLASGSRDNTIKIWNTESGEFVQTLYGHSKEVSFVAWNDDDQLASGSFDKTIRIWDMKSGELVKTLEGHTEGVTSVAWNDNLLASGSDDMTIRIWDTVNDKCVKTLDGHGGWVNSVVWDGKLLVSSGSGDTTIKIWDTMDYDDQYEMLDKYSVVRTLNEHSNTVFTVALNHNLSMLASGSSDRTIRIWNTNSGECVMTLKGHRDIVNSVAWNGNQLASGSHDKTIKIWNTESGEYIKTLDGHSKGVLSVAWNHNQLASGSHDKTIKIWDTKSGECTQTLMGISEWVYSVAWNDNLVASCDFLRIRIWDTKSGKCVKILKGHNDMVSSVAWNGILLASGSDDNTIKIWNTVSGDCVQTLVGHSDNVGTVAWNGNLLASGSDDNTIKVWDTDDGTCVKTLNEHTEEVTSVAWYGNQLVSGSCDMTIIIWGTEH